MAKTTTIKKTARTLKNAPRRKAQRGQATPKQMGITAAVVAVSAGLGALGYKLLAL